MDTLTDGRESGVNDPPGPRPVAITTIKPHEGVALGPLVSYPRRIGRVLDPELFPGLADLGPGIWEALIVPKTQETGK